MDRLTRATMVLVAVTVVFILGCSSDSKTLKITPSSLKFNDVNLGDAVSLDLVLKNKFGKDIVISTSTTIVIYKYGA